MTEMIPPTIHSQVVSAAEEQAPVVDIMTALQESIDLAKAQKKPMKKATGKAKTSAAKDKKAS